MNSFMNLHINSELCNSYMILYMISWFAPFLFLSTLDHVFLCELMYKFMKILWTYIHIEMGFWTFSGTPEFMFFHRFMSEIADLTFIYKRNHIFFIISEENHEKNGELFSDFIKILMNSLLNSLLNSSALRAGAVSYGASPCYRCSRATCLMVSQSVWQKYSANSPLQIPATFVSSHIQF